MAPQQEAAAAGPGTDTAPYNQVSYPGPDQSGESAWTPIDGEAISKIRVFGLVGIVSLVIGFVSVFGLSGMDYLTALTLRGPRPAFSLGIIGIFALTAVLLLSVALEVLSIIYGRSAFRSLSAVDSNFRTPLSLSYSLYVGFAMLIVGFTLTVVTLLERSSGSMSGVESESMLVAGGLLVIGAAIALIIGEVGLLLGVWRFGTRYDEGLFKIAAVLYIIPFAAVLAPLLVYLGAGSVEKKKGGPQPADPA